MSLATADQDVVSLVIELDGQHLVRRRCGLGDHAGWDLLLVKVSPHGDVGLLRSVHHGKLGVASLIQDGEGNTRHFVGELTTPKNVDKLQGFIIPDLKDFNLNRE